MSCRGVGVSIVGALLCAATPPPGEPLKPVKSWIVNYDTSECTAQRSYGTAADPVILVLGPTVSGDDFELLIVRNGRGPHWAEELEGSVDFGLGPIKAWLLHYGNEKPSPRNFIKFRISAEQMAQAKSATKVTFHVRGQPDVSFALASMPNLLSTIDRCTADLQHYWNMVDPEQKNIAAPAVGDLRGIFSAEDYPSEAQFREQEGEAEFVLLIDEQGKVAACHVLKQSGIPVFDGMGCQVIRERAKFKPAVDHNGKALRSVVVTPPVRWRLEG